MAERTLRATCAVAPVVTTAFGAGADVEVIVSVVTAAGMVVKGIVRTLVDVTAAEMPTVAFESKAAVLTSTCETELVFVFNGGIGGGTLTAVCALTTV